MSVLGWMLFGFVVGLIARAVMPGRDPLGLVGTTVLGIVGAVLAGWLGQAFNLYGPDEGAGFVAATMGAVIVIAIYHLVTARREPIDPKIQINPTGRDQFTQKRKQEEEERRRRAA